ncbi:MAG: hypothetical protein A2Y15_09040 [Clostridiales bacterium GWF2_36_10]|nr:MAG: hypothetical protein A2Y15_09040 [Clostridiales bacterium GWF2_36_10]HAN20616.1 ABC transporter permease [Clostridiales bacterium]
MVSIVNRIIKQIFHDKRSLALILVVPLLLLTLMYLLLGKSSYITTVAVYDISPQIKEALCEQEIVKVIEKDSTNSDQDYIKNGDADAVIYFASDGIHITMLEMDNVKMSAVTNAVKDAISSINPAGKLNISFVYGTSNGTTFDLLGYLLLSILSFFMIFIISGISFVRERTSDTLERLMRTPVKTISIVCGYICGFGFFAVIQSTLMILFSKFVLKMQFVGQWWIATVIMLLIAIIAVMLGILISVLSKSEFQVVQFIPIIIVPQIFFSGLIPVDTLPYHLSYLSHIMPLYYGCMGLKGVLIKGSNFIEIFPYIFALIIFIVILFISNLLAVRKYRTI